jgi:hypothetical protein
VGSNALVVTDPSSPDSSPTLFETLRMRSRDVAILTGPDPLPLLLRKNVLPGMTLAVRREFLSHVLPIPPAWTHDSWIVLLAALRGTMRVLPTSLVLYRQHDANVVGAQARSVEFYARRLLAGPKTAELHVARYEAVLRRLRDDQTGVRARQAVSMKLSFERQRSEYPSSRLRRVFSIAAAVTSGGYRRHASNGNLNAIRDLVSRDSV